MDAASRKKFVFKGISVIEYAATKTTDGQRMVDRNIARKKNRIYIIRAMQSNSA